MIKRILFILFYAVYFIPGAVFLMFTFISGLFFGLILWIVTGEDVGDNEKLMDYVTYPVLVPFILFKCQQ